MVGPSGWQGVLNRATRGGQKTVGSVNCKPPVPFALLDAVLSSVVALYACRSSENLGESSKDPRDRNKNEEQVRGFEANRSHFV